MQTAYASLLDSEERNEVELEDKVIAVYIATENCISNIIIRKEPDQTYQYEAYEDEVRIYVNGEKVYEGERLREDGSPYSELYHYKWEYEPSSNSWGNGSGYVTPNKKYDAYDVYDYDNPDDFAEEWGEEFGDGSYEDGYDDAYDYWEENR